LGIGNSLIAELTGTVRAMEIAKARYWDHFWHEADSLLVALDFKSS